MVKYINHVGDAIIFNDGNGLFLNENDLRGYEWSYEVTNKKITNIDNITRVHTLPVVFAGPKRAEIANKFFSIVDKDIVENEAGRLYIDDYYLQGYFFKSDKSRYSNGVIYKNSLGFVSTGLWHKEILKSFNVQLAPTNGSKSLDYPHDAPHDYTSPLDVRLTNTNYTYTDFRLVIYGECENPTITIGEHNYTVNCEVESGEYLVIDSIEKTIYKVGHTGNRINMFNKRDRENYIFEKIPTGTMEVYRNGSFSFDIVLIENRSEPKWN